MIHSLFNFDYFPCAKKAIDTGQKLFPLFIPILFPPLKNFFYLQLYFYISGNGESAILDLQWFLGRWGERILTVFII